MNKVLIVGDIHGDVKAVQLALSFPGKVIFLGDLLDSFVYPPEMQILCVDIVLDAVESGRAILLKGNHENSYLQPDKFKCSGFRQTTFVRLMNYDRRERLTKCCLPYLWVCDNILLSHAGLSFRAYPGELTLPELKMDLARASRNENSYFYVVGKLRGGSPYSVGGPLWCDAEEFVPIEGILQIFGHTPQKEGKIRIFRDGSMCIDVLQEAYLGVVLDMETKNTEIVSLGQVGAEAAEGALDSSPEAV